MAAPFNFSMQAAAPSAAAAAAAAPSASAVSASASAANTVMRSTLATPPTSGNVSSRPSSASSPPAPLINPFAEYESLGIIGRGKYSEVHKARHRATGEVVAVKKVQIFEMDSLGRKECINEANILQALPSHPHIIKYKHSYLYENDLYLVLELAESGDISLLLENQRAKGSYFQEAEIWHYFVQIADALFVMHSCRVMHRDIKPANVFLTAAPAAAAASSSSSAAAAAASGQAQQQQQPAPVASASSITVPGPNGALQAIGMTIKLGDLGLGRYLSSKTYETFSMVGTPFYMSPEAIANTGYHFKSDVWSAGCLLYEIAALRSPFYSTSLNFYTLGNKITKADYDKPPAHFSKTLQSLIAWMISPQPDDRPDIGQVLRVAQLACESIARTGTVSDAIPVGAAVCPSTSNLPQSRPQSKQGPSPASGAGGAGGSGGGGGMSDD